MEEKETLKARRATRILEVAQELYEREGTKAAAEGILEAPDMVSIFAVACAMSVIGMKDLSDNLASELAGTALRTIIRNLMIQGVEIPQL